MTGGIRSFIVLSAWAGLLPAQSIEVRLREDTSGQPVVGALVRLLDERGPVAQGLSNATGRIVLRAPGPGTFRLKVDRIGWVGVVAGPYELSAESALQREIRLPAERAVLPAISVSGSSRCSRIEQGGPLAAYLWDEIRTALTASTLAAATRELAFHVKVFNRELSLRGIPFRERLEQSDVVWGHRYSALPAVELAERGFIFSSDTSNVYAAPDAALLLSDEFVATHCFRSVSGEGSLIGLQFQPISRAGRIDVRGTLWVDRRTSELDYLEYRYTGIADTTPGGRVALRRTPTGAWIVHDWMIRYPHVTAADTLPDGSRAFRVIGYRERGARVAIASDSTGRITRSLVTGRLWDSLSGAPLAGISVYVEGLSDTIVSAPDGRYSMALEEVGPHTIRARHWKLELLDATPGRQRALSWGDTARVDFGVPSAATLARALCEGSDTLGVVGVLRGVDGPATGSYQIELTLDALEGGQIVVTTPRRNGLFAFCWNRTPLAPVRFRVTRFLREALRGGFTPRPGFQWVELPPLP